MLKPWTSTIQLPCVLQPISHFSRRLRLMLYLLTDSFGARRLMVLVGRQELILSGIMYATLFILSPHSARVHILRNSQLQGSLYPESTLNKHWLTLIVSVCRRDCSRNRRLERFESGSGLRLPKRLSDERHCLP